MVANGPTKACMLPLHLPQFPPPFAVFVIEVAYACAESNAAASGEAYHSLQARHQALQASLAEHSLQSTAAQHGLNQQLHSMQSDLAAVKQERDAAVTGLKALQICHEKSWCSLHVGLSQVNSADLPHAQKHLCIQAQHARHTQNTGPAPDSSVPCLLISATLVFL